MMKPIEDKPKHRKKIVVAMSGGVDSAVVAALLKEQGHEVIGITMQIWNYSGTNRRFGSCCSLEDVHDARNAAAQIGIPFYVMKLEKEFREEVVHYFIRQYLAGATPNPCVPCNQRMKFHFLLKRAMELGADLLATGHYASVVRAGDRLMIRKGKDNSKDQSYFLFNLSQRQLEKIIFPLGNYTKSTVRRLAGAFGLNVAHKKESQEICFVEGNDYGAFIKKEMGEARIPVGPIINAQGKKIGTHKGTPFYTIGQRRGLGVSASAPLYVTHIHPEKREVVVGHKEDLYQDEFEAHQVNWYLTPKKESRSVKAKVRIRYRSKESESEIFPVSPDKVRVKLKNPQPAIAPGQAAVFYRQEVVLGGGWIS